MEERAQVALTPQEGKGADMKLHKVPLALCVVLAACAHPPLAISPGTQTATVDFRTDGGGITQHYLFSDPVSCKGPSVITSVGSRESKVVALPAGVPITIWTSAVGLPAPLGMAAWCRPTAFSTRLVAGKRYRAAFWIDEPAKRCGVAFTSLDAERVAQVPRRVSGPEVMGGPLTAPMSCDASDDLSRLK